MYYRIYKPLAICLLSVLASCKTAENPFSKLPNEEAKTAKAVAEVLEDYANIVEEYGTISVGSPIFARPGDIDGFDLNKPSKEYFDDAKASVQMASASLVERVSTYSFGASSQQDLVTAASYLDQLQRYQAAQQNNALAQDRAEQKNRLRDTAARIEYRAALEAAESSDSPAVARADALRNYADALSEGKTETVTFPESTAEDLSTTKDILNSEPTSERTRLSEDKFKGLGGLLPTGLDLSLSSRDAISQSGGDKITEVLYRLLSNPNLSPDGDSSDPIFADKTILFGATTVSVNPGRRTRKNYMGRVSLEAKFSHKKARRKLVWRIINNSDYDPSLRRRLLEDYKFNLSDGEVPKELVGVTPMGVGHAITGLEFVKEDKLGEHFDNLNPLITSALPLDSGQIIDESASIRRQSELTILLSLLLKAPGNVNGAGFFKKYVKSLQRDARSRSREVSANSFSISGGVFGYEVGPSTRTNDYSSKQVKSKGLERSTFPALFIISFDDTDLDPRFVWKTEGDRSNRFLRVYEPQFVLLQTPHWISLKKGQKKENLETERLALSMESFFLRECIGDQQENQNAKGGDLYKKHKQRWRYANRRLKALRSQTLGAGHYASLPIDLILPHQEPEAVQFKHLIPESHSINLVKNGEVEVLDSKTSEVQAILTGIALDQVNTSIEDVGTMNNVADVISIEPLSNSESLLIKARVNGKTTSPLVFLLKSKISPNVTLHTPPIVLNFIPPPKHPQQPPQSKDVTISLKEDGTDHTITFPANAQTEQIQAAAKIFSKSKDKSKPNTTQ